MINASIALVLVLGVIGLKLAGKVDWLALIVCLLAGASIANLLMPAVNTLGEGLASATAMLSGMLG